MGLLQGRGLLFPAGVVALAGITLLDLLYGTLTSVQALLIGVLLLATAEVGYWSFELQATIPRQRKAILWRSGVILALTLAGTAITGAGASLFGTLR